MTISGQCVENIRKCKKCQRIYCEKCVSNPNVCKSTARFALFQNLFGNNDKKCEPRSKKITQK